MLCYDKINDDVHDDDDDNDDHVMITDSKGLNLLILMVNKIKVFYFLKVTLSKGQLKILITYMYVLTCSMKSNQIIEIIFQSKNLKYFYVSKVNGHKLDRITILKIYIN